MILNVNKGEPLSILEGGTGKNTHTSNAVLTGNRTGAIKNVASASGALYATGKNGAPKFGTLPIAQGGTGKTTKAEALGALGGMSMELIWENASPTSVFPAQTVSVNYTDYDYVFALGKIADGNEYDMLATPLIPAVQGHRAMLNYIGIDFMSILRQMSLVSGGVSFTSGSMVTLTNGTTYNGWDSRAIPLVIFGVKGVQ